MAWPSSSSTARFLFVMLLAVAATRAPGMEVRASQSMAPFQKVRDRLLRAKGATVGAGCGSASAPWAYRGARGDSLALKSVVRAEADARWAKDLAEVMMLRADWDSTDRFHGINKPCREQLETPHFVVCWHVGNDDVYALFAFETRCALVFNAEEPLGTVWLRDRADTLFRSIQQVLAGDSLIHSMSTPLEQADRPAPARSVWVEDLPEVIENVRPDYPTRAREEGWQGTVEIQALIGKDGLVHDAYVVKAVKGLDDAALACVWDWRFKPAKADGEPVAVWVRIPVKFRLTN